MKHVLLTKFAVRFAEDNPRRRYEQNPEWLDYRMDLFKRYCLPSVQAQTFKNFEWWFLVNPSFPNLKPNHIETLEQYGNILHVESDFHEAQPEIGERLGFRYKKEWVCSTRLDSDDMLRNCFMQELHTVAKEKEQFISFQYGYIVENGKAAKREYIVNPFVSYVEHANPFRSVFCIDHTKIDKTGVEVVHIPIAGWAQIDHGDNIKNHARNKVRNFDDVCFDFKHIEGFPL